MRKTTLLACAFALGAPFLAAQGKTAPRPPSRQAQTPKAEKLPSGESIMDRFIEATGGVDAHKKIKSVVIAGTFSVPAMGMNPSLAIYKASPNLSLVEMDLPGMGKILEGCDGSNAWGYSAMTGPIVKSGRAAEEALEEARLDDHNWRDRYTGAETKGVEKVEGEDCYKVELARRAGGPRVQYFSKATGLLVKLEAKAETEMGALPIAVTFKDYRKVGDLLMSFRQINVMGDQEMEMAYSEIKLNVDIPRSKFDPPAEVRELIPKEGAAKR